MVRGRSCTNPLALSWRSKSRQAISRNRPLACRQSQIWHSRSERCVRPRCPSVLISPQINRKSSGPIRRPRMIHSWLTKPEVNVLAHRHQLFQQKKNILLSHQPVSNP